MSCNIKTTHYKNKKKKKKKKPSSLPGKVLVLVKQNHGSLIFCLCFYKNPMMQKDKEEGSVLFIHNDGKKKEGLEECTMISFRRKRRLKGTNFRKRRQEACS